MELREMSPHRNFLICICKIEYCWRQNILKSSLFLYCWNLICVTQFDMCCTDWDKLLSSLSHAQMRFQFVRYRNESNLGNLSWIVFPWRQKGFRPVRLRFRPVGFRFRLRGLCFRPVVIVLDQWVFVLDDRVFVLYQWIFVLDHRVFV